MRQIKFRAWDIKEKKLIDWDILSGYCDIDFLFGGAYERDKGHPYPYPIAMQCTGLKDKNGKEIYEGDILEAEHKLKTQKFKRKYQVIFNEKGYWDAISLDDKPVRLCYAGFDKCEIVGNIYENPELLEVKS